MNKIFHLVKELRKKTDIPLVFLSYYNPIFHYGVERFVEDAVKSGVDGVIVADLPPEEAKEIKIFSKYFNDKNYSINEKIALPKFAYQGYLRAEAECKKEDGSLTFSATSPCYFYK